MKHWEPLISKSPDILLRDSFETARRWRDFARLRRERPELDPLADLLSIPEYTAQDNLMLPTRIGLTAQSRWMAQSYTDGTIPIQPRPLVESCFYHDLRDSHGSEPPEDSSLRMGGLSDRTKQFYTLAMFDLFTGQRDESLKLLANSYLIGQRFPDASEGFWMRETAMKGLFTLALNACESPAERQAMKAGLDRLHALPDDSGGWFNAHPAALFPLMKRTEKIDELVKEWDAQKRRLKTELELLRMAVAAREFLLTTGDFPTSPTQPAPSITGGIPVDPFSESVPLKYKKVDGDALIYGSGPDRRDDHGTLLLRSIKWDHQRGRSSAACPPPAPVIPFLPSLSAQRASPSCFGNSPTDCLATRLIILNIRSGFLIPRERFP